MAETITASSARKSRRTKFIAVNVTPEMHDRAHRRAASEGLPLSWVLRRLLVKWTRGEINVA